jgi:hypothetical protein
MFVVYAISLLLIGLSGVLLDMHRRSWRAAEEDTTLSQGDLRFARAQYRRRTQASGIIGVLGAAIGVGPLVPAAPWPMAIYVASLGGACACIMLLAGLDLWATRMNYERLRSEQLAAEVKLAREIVRDDTSGTDNLVRRQSN